MTSIGQRREEAIRRQLQAVRDDAPFYLQACPGAGKTRVIVDRHINRGGATGRSGRALVSFTNVACDEIHQRCHDTGHADLLRFPHFVGTIDTFIWRYLVRPFTPEGKHRIRIDSWDRIGATTTVYGKRPYPLSLSDFQFHYDIPAQHYSAEFQLSHRTYVTYKALENEGLLDEAGRQAAEASIECAKQGHVTGHEIRILALHSLRKYRTAIASMLHSRFDELIVDEAQDCSNMDLAILAQLREAGVPLIFVCDPDQAIYEFRGAEPEQVRQFGATLGTRPVELTGNWRSSPAICRLAATLRPAKYGRSADDPIGDHHDEQRGILLIPANTTRDTDQAVEIFTEQAQQLGIPSDDQVVLAHAATKLPKRAASRSQPPSSPPAARLAWAAAILADPNHTARQRETAYDIAERTLLRYWHHDIDGQTVDAHCEQHALDRPSFRRAAARCLVALPSVDHGTFREWCAAANKVLERHPPKPGAQRQGQKGRLAPGKRQGLTPRDAANVPPANLQPGPRVSVIHQIKGEQADAVLVIVPDDNRAAAITRAWTSGVHPPDIAENLRVLYVAATRARRLLAFALPATFLQKVQDHLRNQDIPLNAAVLSSPCTS